MQDVSTNFHPWLHSRRVDVRLRFELLDVNAKASARASANEQANVTQLQQLTDGVQEMEKYATLEPDFFVWMGAASFFLTI